MTYVAEELDEIEARANAAQASPWWADRWEDFYGKEITYSIETSTTSRVADYISDPDDAQFIAHAREDVPQLVTALRAVLDLCTPQNAPDICARNVRNAIESALGGA